MATEKKKPTGTIWKLIKKAIEHEDEIQFARRGISDIAKQLATKQLTKAHKEEIIHQCPELRIELEIWFNKKMD